MEPAALLASSVAKQQWFWGAAASIVVVLLLANAALFLVVYGRRLRELVRARRAARFQRECEQMLEELTSGRRDLEHLRARIRRFDELERPIAATMLLERLGPASAAERTAVLDALREAGGSTCSCDRFTAARPGGAHSPQGRSGRLVRATRCLR